MELQDRIERFLSGSPHAVVGASANREKYGNKVLRAYLKSGRAVFPVHPSASEIEGLTAYPTLASLPVSVHGISIITPPEITERIVEEAGQLGIVHLWMQPGAQNERSVAIAQRLGMNLIAGNACLLLASGLSRSPSTSEPYAEGGL